MSKSKKKIVIPIVMTIIIGIAIAGIVFWINFFSNPFAERVSTEKISAGSVSMTGDSNVLVAYFSLEGNRKHTLDKVDAVSSSSLEVRDGQAFGHAELMALAAQETTGGDLFFVEVSEKYPETYAGALERHRSEMTQDIRPELAVHVENMEGYNTVILIYPTWMGRMPQALLTFLEEYDFSGKTIIPIATSQAVGLGSGPEQIASACPDAKVIDGLSARDENAVSEFLTGEGFAK